MNGTETEKLRLLDKIAEGLRVKPAYLLFFAILVVILFIVIGFLSWDQRDPTITIGAFALCGVALLVAPFVIKTVEVAGRVPKEQRDVMNQLLALGTKEDIPLSKAKAERWAKRWNCRWTYLSKSGQLRRYVDDNVTFDLNGIDTESGLVQGRGESPYRGGTTYEIFGRLSKRDMALMFYRFRGELEALMGVMIVRMRAGGSAHGWWLGIGKENMDIGGRFTWTDSRQSSAFEPKEYPVRDDPPLDSTFVPAHQDLNEEA